MRWGFRRAQGLVLTTGFYWDLDDETRAWSAKYEQKTGRKPTMVQAGVYSSVLHYLKAVEAAGTDDGLKVANKMKELPVKDMFAKNAKLLPNGRLAHDMYLARVKQPVAVQGPLGLLRDRQHHPRRSKPIRRPRRAAAPSPRSKASDYVWLKGGLNDMMELLGVPPQVLFGQLLLGLINGSFYALLSLGLAVIFGMLNVINFAHGAQYMLGAFAAWMLLKFTGIGYWWALILAPLVVGLIGVVLEKLMLSRLYKLDHLYGLLLTFGLALIIEGMFRHWYGVSGQPYPIPKELAGGYNLGFMFLPTYRAWVVIASVVVCFGTWFVIERTKLGRLPARRHREPGAGPGLRHQRAGHDHRDLRRRRGAGRAGRRAGGARSIRSTR